MKRVRKGVRVLFLDLFCKLRVGIVQRRARERVAIATADGSRYALYLEDVVGVLRSRRT